MTARCTLKMKNDCYIRHFEIRLDNIKVQQSRVDMPECHKFRVIIIKKLGTTFGQDSYAFGTQFRFYGHFSRYKSQFMMTCKRVLFIEDDM